MGADKLLLREFEIRSVIFDMDGVLVDTREPLLQAWSMTLDAFEIAIPIEELSSMVLGVVDYEKIEKALYVRSVSKNNIHRLIREAEDNYRALFHKFMKPVKGLVEFLDELNQQSIPMVVATSANKETLDTIINTLDLSRYFHYMLSADDVAKRKPNPEVFALAAALLKAKNGECLVLEDAPEGIKAAKDIHMRCMAITTTYPKEKLMEADWIIGSYMEFPWKVVHFNPPSTAEHNAHDVNIPGGYHGTIQ